MKRKPARILVGIVGVAALAVMALLLAGVQRVDRRPFLEGAYASQTLARLSHPAVHAEARCATGAVWVGFGRATLNPTIGVAKELPEEGVFQALPLAGYGRRRGKPATGVHDDLWVKALAVTVAGRTGVVVSADLLIVPREVAELAVKQIQDGCGLTAREIYFGATHTHCGPGGWGEGWVAEAFGGRFQPGVRIWLARRVAEAVLEAVADLQPASMAADSFEAPEFVRNRLLGENGVVDAEFIVLSVRRERGDAAVIGSYAAHATVLSSGFMQWSADYPGAWQRRMEQDGVAMAMFLAGAVGSHGPRAPESGWAGAVAMGEALAERTASVLSAMTYTNRIVFAFETLDVALPEIQVCLLDDLRLRPWLAHRLVPVPRETRLQGLRFGPLVWLSTPSDFSGELALDLKARARARGVSAAVTSFNGDYVGYVVPEPYYALDTYETRTMSFFGPQLPGYFVHLLGGLMDVIAPEPAFTNAVGRR